MKVVNYGKKYNIKINIRMNEDQYEFLQEVSKLAGVSPSQYVRMLLDSLRVKYNSNKNN